MNIKTLLSFILILCLLPVAYADVQIRLGEPHYNVDDLTGLGFSAYTDTYALCSGESVIVPVFIKNNNEFSDVFEFSLSDSYASLSVSKAQLAPGQSALLPVRIDAPFEEVESVILTVITREERLKRGIVIPVAVSECYKLSMNFTQTTDSVCGCSSKSYALLFENDGRSDEYDILIDAPDFVNHTFENDTLELSSGETNDIIFTANVGCDVSGSFPISVTAISSASGIEKTATLDLMLSSLDQCYGTDISIDDVTIDRFGKNIPITVRNNGKFDADYAMKVDGVDWHFLSQPAFSLASGEKRIVNLALHPTEEIAAGDYGVTVSLERDGVNFTQTMNVRLKDGQGVWKSIINALNFAKYYIGLLVVLVIAGVFVYLKRGSILPKKKPKDVVVKQAKSVVTKEVVKKDGKSPVLERIYMIIVGLVFVGAIAYGITKLTEVEVDSSISSGLDIAGPYIGYFIGAVLIIAIIMGAFSRAKKSKKKISNKTKNTIKHLLIILLGLFVLSGIVYALAFYGLWTPIKNFFLIYSPYIISGVVLLVILILGLKFYNKE